MSGPQRGAVLQTLLEAARRRAAERGLAGVVWPYLAGHVAKEIALLCPSARVVLHSADTAIDVPVGGLAALSASVRCHDRAKWRTELRAFARDGGTLEWRPLRGDVAEHVARLVAANRAKHGADGDVAEVRRIFTAQEESGAARTAIVCMARSGDRTLGAAVFYRHADWLYGRYCGMAHDAPAFTHFVLAYYAAMDFAATRGFRRVHVSVSAWEAKVRRGATLHPLAMIVAPPLGERQLVSEAAARDHNARFVKSWQQRFATRPSAIDASWWDWA